jgi:hypothetical protein
VKRPFISRSEGDDRLDPRTLRALKAEVAAPTDPRYWERLESRIMWRVANAGSDDWAAAFRAWSRMGVLAASLAIASLFAVAWRQRATEGELAYESVMESRAPMPVQLRTHLVDSRSADEATLRYVLDH